MDGRIRDNLIESYEKEARSNRHTFIAFVFLILFAFAVYYLRTQVIIIVDVEGESMRETLQNGDVVVANMKATPKRGDIVIFPSKTEKGKVLIKRVIGLEGDTVWEENGFVKISYIDENGKEVVETLKEDYLSAQGVTDKLNKTTVAKGCVYVLGDNRVNSNDSRFFGSIKKDAVIGVVTEWSVRHKDGFFGKLYGLL